ncbi:telomeric repeat-binding factor 1 isoform X2 [Anabas testudineus]|uniref:telomeric repeat-binding factor 1 isoform X2 n=1 Tax=Anabas testudineus TaxID=64144 RepID=UPI000E4544B8|nr:telomeric repeat-binding factor 1 isoform X2 [Anabas testudineus]
MDPEQNNQTAAETSSAAEDEAVTAVATGWMLDFLFLSLCRSFKEAELDEFNEKLSTFESMCQCPSLKGDLHDEKMKIVALLARVMHGKQLDVHFDEDDSVMPLMSATIIWSKLKGTVADKSLFKNITILLVVQSVAVCLEKGQRCAASSALNWFGNNHEFSQLPMYKNVRVMLSTVVTNNDTCHPYLTSFSFSRLLETIQCYLDAFLEKNPCDHLLKEATKMVQSSQYNESLEDGVTQNSSVLWEDKKNETKCLRKRQLFPTKITDLWKPDSCKKPYVSVQRLSTKELSRRLSRRANPRPPSRTTSKKVMETSVIQKTRKPPQKWTPQLDKYLMDGVKCHGQGKWSLILKDFDFEGRTGTMLKDRWRVLLRTHKVG